MDSNILEISVICTSEESATTYAKDNALLLSDTVLQNSNLPSNTCALGKLGCQGVAKEATVFRPNVQ